MEPEQQEYKGHRIELRPSEATAFRASDVGGEPKPRLLIDDAHIEYGQFSDGTYALHENAYERADNLMELARRLIDYRIGPDDIRQERQPNGGD